MVDELVAGSVGRDSYEGALIEYAESLTEPTTYSEWNHFAVALNKFYEDAPALHFPS